MTNRYQWPIRRADLTQEPTERITTTVRYPNGREHRSTASAVPLAYSIHTAIWVQNHGTFGLGTDFVGW